MNSTVKSLLIRHKQWVIFLVFFVIWFPCMYWCFPGNMAWDTGDSIKWYLNLDRSNVNLPPFQNMLMGCFYSIGRLLGNPVIGVSVYCYIQVALEMILLARIVTFEVERFTRKWCLFPIAIYFIIPAFPIYAITMAKDSNFAIAILLFEYYALQYAADPEKFFLGNRKIFAVAGSILLISLFRNGAGYIPAIAFVLLSLNKKKMVPCLTLIAVLAIYHVIPACFSIPKVEIKESMSLPLQMTAYYVINHEDELTDNQKQTINEVVDLKKMIEAYDPDIADPIKDQSKFTIISQMKFIKMWAHMCFTHPGTMIKAFYLSTNKYYIPSANPAQPYIRWGMDHGNDWQAALGLEVEQLSPEQAKKVVDKVFQLPVISLFAKCGLYFWIAIIMVLLCASCNRLRRYLFCMVPLVMIIIGCIFSPVNGLFRYAYSIVLSTPVIVSSILYEIVFLLKQ